jgi:Domain of unknown function (DUF1844)
MSEQPPSDPKIIVDEDWKSRVAAEKEAVAGQPSAPQPAESAGPKSAAESRAAHPLPPATLSFLITTLATQAMVALGEVPHPLTGKAEQRLPEAQHFIEVLAMLEDKTAGNRTPEESALLDGFLHQLRLAFVELKSRPAGV